MTPEQLKQIELKYPVQFDRIRDIELTHLQLEELTPMDLFNEWLKYEGIIGYTGKIIQMLVATGAIDSIERS